MTLSKTSKNFLLNSKWLVFGSLIIFLIANLYYNKIFSIRFVDEEDNFVLGHFLIQGQKLYSDLFSHHQPLAYIISAGWQIFANPQNIYELIKTQREFMIGWSIVWGLILIWRFKEKIIFPLLIFELTKFYLLGNLFLSESLVVYPVIYLFAYLFNLNIKYKYEIVFVGFLIGVSALLLAPIWPFLITYLILLFWFGKVNKQQIIFLLAGGLMPIIAILPFIDIYYYFHNVFYINYKYYVPQSAEEKMPLAILKAFFSPITALIYSWDFKSSGLVLKVVGIFFIASICSLIKKKNFKILIASIILLTLANLRYYTPGLQYSAGFHLLIWYALFILIAFYFYIDWINNIKLKYLKFFLTGILLVGICLITFSSKEIFNKNDLIQDYELNYSKQELFGDAIKIMKNPDDNLFVIPDEWLLYFQGDIKNHNKMVNFYGWMSLVWELNDPVIDKFKTTPPQFFYCDCEESVVLGYADNYRQMIKDGARTSLWILNTKFDNLSEDQRNGLRKMNFQLE